ncbi:xanthine dehydrogenase family protein subunit M [Candidatus Bathyarchaeota archaeon]|nr:xanthine dehydrogenase family protein subunit M [Candidatus Bathyarchaeota archaeon]
MEINRVNTRIIPFRFEYHSPSSLGEALTILSRYGSEARILAGGTDLLVDMKQRLIEPRHLVDIKRIPELKLLGGDAGGFMIGSAVRLRELERSEAIKGRLPLLHEAISSMGSVQVRNMATLGGNLCRASPSADAAVALLALEAEALIAGPTGTKKVPLEGFFLGPRATLLRPDEILTGVYVPYPPEGAGSAFIKLGRTSLDLAIVNIAVVLKLRGGIVEHCRIAMGAVAPKPLRLRNIESFLSGRGLTPEALEEALGMVEASIKPITDIRATADYRREVSKVLLRDAIKTAVERCGGLGS